MPITVFHDRIEFNNYSLVLSPSGLTVNGTFVNQGGIVALSPLVGTVSGYRSGGRVGTGPSSNVIDKFPFSTDANATDVGDLTQARYYTAGQSSQTNGYTSAGLAPFLNTIDKFPFATNANATDVGDVTNARRGPTGQSSSSNGYASGGLSAPSPSNIIEKFPFASNANASDVGDLTQGRSSPAGQSSETSGYTSGGYSSPSPLTVSNVIDKFPFSTDANATDVGDITVARYGVAGQSSQTNGYSSGGLEAPPSTGSNTIDRFPFATDANATDVGDLTRISQAASGQSSTTHGYTSGGYNSSSPNNGINVIDKFSFATNANATDVGDLTQTIAASAGQQD